MHAAVRALLLLFVLGFPWTPGPLLAQDKVFVCPMDPDVRSNQPGNCRRCGMKLREGIPEPVEFHLDLALTPRAVKPNQTKQTENLQVEMTTDPPQPIAAQKTLIYFRLSPADGLEKYIGAWAHMLVAS